MQPESAPTPPTMPTPPPQAPPVAPPPVAPAPNPSGYESNPFKLFAPSWQAIKLNLGTWILTYLLAGAVFMIPGVVAIAFIAILAKANQDGNAGAIGIGFGLVMLVLGLAVIWISIRFLGMTANLLLSGAKGIKLGVGEAWNAGKPYGLKLFGFTLLYALAVMIGFILFIIPGFLMMIWFAFGPYIIVNENSGVMEAFSRSKALVKGRFWEIFGVQSTPQLVGMLYIIPVIGSIVSGLFAIAYSSAMPVRYLSLKQAKDTNAPLPPISKVNYALPIVYSILLVIGIGFGIMAANSANQNGSSGTIYNTDTSTPSSTDTVDTNGN